jgi:hypothetical protein
MRGTAGHWPTSGAQDDSRVFAEENEWETTLSSLSDNQAAMAAEGGADGRALRERVIALRATAEPEHKYMQEWADETICRKYLLASSGDAEAAFKVRRAVA